MDSERKKEGKPFNPKKSIQRARANRKVDKPEWTIKTSKNNYVWSSKMDRISLLREGLPYESIEFLSDKSNLSVKQILAVLDLPQTTYNKRKRDQQLLSGRDSEVVLVLVELLEFGLNVFNFEKEKFHRWLRKPNISLGGAKPINLFDSITGIQEVKNSLTRLEYGNLA